ncbi:hypothetical protein PC129_g21989 [Phytophthora cactorum]|uniref:RxLR effector protein n=1 Tax=Phytophthora cactorum TaxID=29920 RepID=A0A329RUB6_9STRA|nr:hypothetical protein GQ600_6504 [Phytophthora cactorum]KAG2776415.1 hypothetical protein Pcac1_g13209 [Phytophthora cactorum]KAG2804961.1 hypothetical protein PC111_g18030 [Phytophthora cactorum]KAG2874700.1 hypothetical protein PC114_g25126 [Phytophthora cactorum]KAG2881022.1 hypothetical protein PC115_g22339 [Phytophthora cactorum]
MRSIFYVALAFAVLARSSVVEAFPDPDESRLLSNTSPDSAAKSKRSLRVAVQEGRDGNGGIWKAISLPGKIIKVPEIDMKKYLEAAKLAKIKEAAKKVARPSTS